MILDRIVDDYIPLMETIEDDVDTISDSIMSGGSGHIHELMALKRRLQQLRRRMAPLREVINSLLRRDVAMIKDETRPYFQDVYDHAVRVLESVDLQRDTLTSLVDVHLSVVSNKLNEVMKKMTVISTVLMTAALVAGIYGMNFESIPELHWKYGYAYSFGLMFLLSGLILVAFKRQNWI
jgi:magnesium transporter